MIDNKLKSLLKLKDAKNIEYSKALKLKNPQALNTKFSRESFKIQDLIVLGEVTDTKLAFIDKDNKPLIVFDKEDLSK